MKTAITALALLAAAVVVALALCWPTVRGFDQVRASWRPSDAQLLDRHGDPLHEWRVDRRGRRLAWVPLEAISPMLSQVIIASEDRGFFRHHGIDLTAVAGSIARTLVGRKARGASTITMQVAAMLDPRLARDGARRTAAQKFRQMLSALALERRWSKRQILEAYLNLVSWRGEIEGIGAASRLLFGKDPQGIDAAEATVLAALIKAPNVRRPALERRALALDRLLDANPLGANAPSRAEVAAAIDRSLAAHSDDFARAALAPHLAERL